VGVGCVYGSKKDGTACSCQPGEPRPSWTCMPAMELI
jgi:hypothetical protein